MPQREREAGDDGKGGQRPRAPRDAPAGNTRTDWWILGGILLLGAILRFSYWTELKREPIFSAPISDAAFHDYWARALVTGDWTPPEGEPDPRIREVPFLRPPGYPYFLALLYTLTGRSVDGARFLQMLLGLVNCVLAFLLGRAVLGRRAGLILAAFCAFYWAFPYYEGQLHAPVVIIALSFTFLLLLHRWWHRRTLLLAAASGVVIGLIALVRAETLLFIPVAAGWIWFQQRRASAGAPSLSPATLKPALALIGGAILAVSPATIRNAAVAHEFVPISANGPINLYIGNNETADGWTTRIPDLPELTGSSGWSCFSYDRIVSALSDKAGKKLNYSDASAIFSRKAGAFIASHPGRFLALTLKRAALFWGPEEVANNEAIRFERKNSRTLRLNPGFPLVFGFSLGGLILLLWERRNARRRPRDGKSRDGRPAPLDAERPEEGPMLALIGLYVLTCFVALLPFIAASRFRAPVLPLIFVFGAFGIDRLLRWARRGDWRTAGTFAAVVAALTGLGSISLAGVKTDAAWWHTDRALALARHDRKPEAVAELQQALQVNPGYVDAHVSLAGILSDMGQTAQAIPHLQEVLRYRPTRVDVRLELGNMLLKQGNAADAERELRRAAQESPDLPNAWFALGRALLQTGDYAGAVSAFSRTLELTPDEPAALVNRGIARIRSGAPAQALPDIQRALQLKPDLAEAYTALGQAYAAMNNQEKAAQAFQEAYRIDPKSIEPLINIGNTWAGRGDWDNAIQWYRRALDSDPRNGIALYNLAGCQASKGMVGEATQTLNRLLEYDPQNQRARQLLQNLRSGRPG